MTDTCTVWLLAGFSFTVAMGSPLMSFPQILSPGKEPFADGHQNLKVPEVVRMKSGKGREGWGTKGVLRRKGRRGRKRRQGEGGERERGGRGKGREWEMEKEREGGKGDSYSVTNSHKKGLLTLETSFP